MKHRAIVLSIAVLSLMFSLAGCNEENAGTFKQVHGGMSLCEGRIPGSRYHLCGGICRSDHDHIIFSRKTPNHCKLQLEPGCDRIWVYRQSAKRQKSSCDNAAYDGRIEIDELGDWARSADSGAFVCFIGARSACIESLERDRDPSILDGYLY